MKSAMHNRSGHTSSSPAVALVLTLCALVLMTVLLVAFFSKAQLSRQIAFSSTNISKADSMAKAAGNWIIGELRQEIVDGSDVLRGDPDDPNAEYPVIYRPKAGVSPMPVKIGVDESATPGATSLVKVSADGVGVRPSSTAVATNVSIGTSSLNGRRISPEKWFGPGGPVLGSQATLPTWLYISRSGIKTPVLPAAGDRNSSEYIIGRFAYTAYDVSGLLDANVAGYPILATSEQKAMSKHAGGKSSTAYAELKELDPAVFTDAAVNSMVSWRNGEAATSADGYAEYVANYAARDGNLHAVNPPSSDPNKKFTQQRFLSRRDMLRSVNGGKLPGRPEFFTHFSRANTGPTWAPEKNAAEMGGDSSFAYRDDADKTKDSKGDFVVNRNVGNVRHPAKATITRYNDDGTEYTVEVEAGDPMVQQRFSLAKLAWLGHDGPDTEVFHSSVTAAGREKAIKDCFGLRWDANKHSWEYDHGSPNTVYILTLGEITGRDPDFFELLKAGILKGSLAGHPGMAAVDIAGTDKTKWEGPVGWDFENYSAQGDRHIVQIGANIIDQADRNNFPVAIYLNLLNKAFYSDSENRFYNTVFGVENLPVIQRFGLINHMMTDAQKTPGMMGIWFQPELWNPHNSSTAGSSLTDASYPTPTALRVVTYGRCYIWNVREDPSQSKLSPVIQFGNDFENPKLEGIICFKNPGPASTSPKPFFNNPVSITGLEKAAASINYHDATCPSGPDNRYPSGTTWANGAPFLGIYLGEVYRDPRDTADGGSPQYNLQAIPDPYLTLVLEYYDGNDWRPYSTLSRLQTLHNNAGSSASRHGTASWRSSDGHIDPRTDRFSSSAGRIGAGQNSAWKQSQTVRSTLRTTVGAPDNPGPGRNPIFQAWPRLSSGFTHTTVSSTEGPAYLFDDWSTNLDTAVGNNPVSGFRYKDPDGVTRPGDSWRADFSTGDGVMTYHQDLKGANSIQLPSSTRRRPVILNRPFRSVGELGFVYRDQPFKTLDLWSEKGADAGLLDLFATSQASSESVAGRVNLNSAPPEVLASLLSGAAKDPVDATSWINQAEATLVAGAIAGAIENGDKIGSAAELVSQLSTPIFNAASSEISYRNKTYGEAPVRALASTSNSRTWNLLIDVVAQTGRIVGNDLEKFVVEGERRLWISVAIDRFTGEIADQQIEPIDE